LGKHLKKYETSESDLLVFSQKSGRLYGFDSFGTSLFSLMEKEIDVTDMLLEDFKENKEVRSLIYSIYNLLEDKELTEADTHEPFSINYPSLKNLEHCKNPFYYQLNEFNFVIDTEELWIIEKVLPSLAHLASKITETRSFSLVITFAEDNAGWHILFNGKKVSDSVEAQALLPVLMDYIRIGYYHSTDYLISLHAGALYYQDKPLILPAVSGSGKSTLSTYLMEHGFSFLTDEVALIDATERMRPIPMAITLKEGSWKVLENYGISFDGLSVHKRFDGQKVSFLPPKNIPSVNLSVKGAVLIFPQYQKDARTKLTALSTLETLARITSSGYEVRDSYDWETIQTWIQLIESFQKYTIIYSDMDDARKEIERLMTR
jgi:hypothetical protein